jgi:hypothetical protein
MTGKIPAGPVRLAVAIVIAIGALAIGAATASAAPAKVVYSNLNTVPSMVNGKPNEDTYSEAPFDFPFGGMVEFSHRPGVIKSLTAQVDSFTCEHGIYNLENCYTGHPTKKFSYELTAKIYEVGAGEEPGALVASSTERFKIPYRPTTNALICPATPEGKGFGPNCDVGGYLATVKFKRFAPAAVLPERAIIMITSTGTDSPNDVVNVGLQTSYKEWDEALGPGEEGFVGEPPVNEGKPAVGEDPLPEDAFVSGALSAGGWEGYQPVFQVLATP